MLENEVTLFEASRRLGVPYKTLYAYVVRHEVPTRNVGHYRFIDPEALRAVWPARTGSTRKAQGR